ncbi:MAG TPA: DUF4189 domain-containing protein [Spirochaetota bacterium]|nr:DUF4189 domain-containing protein [Spirochaetota bacterium]
MRILFILALLMVGSVLTAYSSVAVYESNAGLIVGWSYNCDSQADADATASQACREHGGRNPKIDLQSDGGWGALASGHDADGEPVWGYCLGASSREEAIQTAIEQVKKAGAVSWKVEDAFLDVPSDAGDDE